MTTTTRTGELIERAAARAVPVVRGVRDDMLGLPTPCAEYDVRALLNHLTHVVVSFQDLAAKREADFSATPDHLGAGGDWRARFEEESKRLAAAWSEPGAEDGRIGSLQLPARTVGSMAVIDLTVHAWDLSRATGLDFEEPDPAVLDDVEALAATMAPTGRKRGAFGEPVPVPESAPRFDRLLGFIGRDPGWRPAAV
ncbi:MULTISPECIES: TIGR03086 family metal-binding protein [Streptomyces]|uniref:TIGR03086 family protein n=1 Tax=Streptomyces lycii TaxID=2654337 RepID=A0ABQ7FIS5_9ACTN|nr:MULTISPECIES: TIGR03086 family metal-binding protein [Streptomyces]KAF4408822.1 TIGR03086 family protein [Streptomyces lycii]PGH47437.1 TIGR03086 family protein [Streptomyces sp. Ru87]